MHRATQRRVLRDFTAGNQKLQVVIPSRLAEQHKRVDEPLDILVRLDVPGVHDEPLMQLIALPHLCYFHLRRLVVKVVSDGIVDDRHLLWRHRKKA